MNHGIQWMTMSPGTSRIMFRTKFLFSQVHDLHGDRSTYTNPFREGETQNQNSTIIHCFLPTYYGRWGVLTPTEFQ